MRSSDDLRKAWRDHGQSAPVAPVMTLTEAGLVLGAGTVLAKWGVDRRGEADLAIAGNEERVLALLSVAYGRGRVVSTDALDYVRRASRSHADGEACLAQIHLAHSGLERLPDQRMAAYRLFLAAALLDDGIAPSDLLEGCGLVTTGLDMLKAGFNPAQPRVPAGSGSESGEWSGEQEAGAAPASAPGVPNDPNGAGNSDEFFDTIYAKIHALAQRLGINENWLLGLAAHESWYLNAHNRALNNPFGLTAAGHNNLRFNSIDDAINYWERKYGPIVQGAPSAEDFIGRLRAVPYNDKPQWPGRVMGVINSIPRRLSAWKAKREI